MVLDAQIGLDQQPPRTSGVTPPVSPPENVNSLFTNGDTFQLHHSDHPNYILCTLLINQQTYHHWRRSVEISLQAKNKFGFVSGKIEPPDDRIATS
ncbi:hypothetical protein LIER_35992 [Lithospermum erythrorhizon]|uniref:Retrotransposon Copia-like N-terminal domain-containing protein n=1 Tax=Lithospermum erythrorhizon TaxID=34254 RepID=A0AAV3P042_LITER